MEPTASELEKAASKFVGIREKLLAIMIECSYIRKDKRNNAMGYNYASEATIKEKVHAAMVCYGVLFQCDVVTFEERVIERVNKDGRVIVEALAKCQFHYIFEDVATGEKREGTFFGTGIDGADKHLYKAITGAIKYILTTTFLIPTGDDAEEPSKLDKAAAREEVKQRKLAEAKASPKAKDPDESKGWFQVMIDGFSAMKETIGSETYYRILGSSGYTHANEIPDRPTALKIYREMAAIKNNGDLKGDLVL